jgi:polysaccharide pyruvyl transferase WcaK-like protein
MCGAYDQDSVDGSPTGLRVIRGLARERLVVKIVIFGGFGTPNIGDEAILAAHLEYYSAHVPHSTIYVMCSDAAYISAIHRSKELTIVPINYINNYSWECYQGGVDRKEAVRHYLGGTAFSEEYSLLTRYRLDIVKEAIGGADILHIAGGGYLNSGFPHALTAIEIILGFCPATCKVVVTGLTLGPFDLGDDERIAKALVARAAWVDLRDEIHADEVRGLTSRVRDKMSVTSDDVFLSSRLASLSSSAGIRDQADSKRDYCTLLIGGDGGTPAEREVMLRELLVSTEELLGRFPALRIRCLQFAPTSRDLEFPARLVENLPTDLRRRIALVDVAGTHPWNVGRIIAGARFNVGTRLHLAVMAFMTLSPVLSLCFLDGGERMMHLHHAMGSSEAVASETLKSDAVLAFASRMMASDRERLVADMAQRRDALMARKAARWHEGFQQLL